MFEKEGRPIQSENATLRVIETVDGFTDNCVERGAAFRQIEKTRTLLPNSPRGQSMKQLKALLAMALLVLVSGNMFASSHREAPITALDRSADVTDWYAFVSYDHPDRVTMILNVDPLLEPANGPNYFPFDPNVLYEMKVDNNHDGIPDITFQFRFTDRDPRCLACSPVSWVGSPGFRRSRL